MACNLFMQSALFCVLKLGHLSQQSAGLVQVHRCARNWQCIKQAKENLKCWKQQVSFLHLNIFLLATQKLVKWIELFVAFFAYFSPYGLFDAFKCCFCKTADSVCIFNLFPFSLFDELRYKFDRISHILTMFLASGIMANQQLKQQQGAFLELIRSSGYLEHRFDKKVNLIQRRLFLFEFEPQVGDSACEQYTTVKFISSNKNVFQSVFVASQQS